MGAAIMVRVLNTGLSLYPPPFYVPEYYFHDLLAPPSPMFCSFGTSRSPRSTDNAAHTRDADTQTDSLLVCSGGVYRARPFHPPPTAYSSLTVGDCLPAQYPHRYFNGRHAPTTVPHSRRAIFPCGVASTLPPQPHPLSLRQNRAPLRPSSSPLTGLPLGCDGCDVSSDPTSHRVSIVMRSSICPQRSQPLGLGLPAIPGPLHALCCPHMAPPQTIPIPVHPSPPPWGIGPAAPGGRRTGTCPGLGLGKEVQAPSSLGPRAPRKRSLSHLDALVRDARDRNASPTALSLWLKSSTLSEAISMKVCGPELL
eukprot:GGOE01029486.1.p1 GENE.GGOE01029486.1~~GGOE01029486.1.p1  ORF type:complete len:341 (+),score=-13.25 GGOE01029486.1:95-1024(+)